MLWWLISATLLAYIHLGESRCECMEKVILLIDDDDSFRLVKTPDHPRNYCPGLNCTWRVVSSVNQSRIYFHADNIDLRDGKDYIEFYDQKYLKVPENASHICTGQGSCSYSTDSKIMTIRFISSSGIVDNAGFNGVVSLYDKKFRELRDKLLRYFGAPLLVLAVAILLGSIYCCYKRKTGRDAEYSKAPTSDKTNRDTLD